MVKRLLTSYYQRVWNRRDLRLLPYLFADACVVHHVNKYPNESVVYSPVEIKRNIEKWIHIFPDLTVDIINLITDNQYASAYCRLKGRHLGQWMGVEPTGKLIDIGIFKMYKIEGGKICEQWTITDPYNLLVQIKVMDEG